MTTFDEIDSQDAYRDAALAVRLTEVFWQKHPETLERSRELLVPPDDVITSLKLGFAVAYRATGEDLLAVATSQCDMRAFKVYVAAKLGAM